MTQYTLDEAMAADASEPGRFGFVELTAAFAWGAAAAVTAFWPNLEEAPPYTLEFAVLLALVAAVAWWSSRRLRGVLRLLPFGTVLFALVAPVALGIYLVTTTAWTVAERRLLPRLVPAA